MSAGGSRRSSVYLVGFMAAGKSTVGPLLAEQLDLPFLDCDRWIEERQGKSIAEIWRDEGEAEFRRLEGVALTELAGRRAVLAAGGGAMVAPARRDLLLSTGLVLWLKVPFAVIWRRGVIERAGRRPLWRDRRSLQALYEEREASYRFAHLTFDLGDEEPSLIARRLARSVRKWERMR